MPYRISENEHNILSHLSYIELTNNQQIYLEEGTLTVGELANYYQKKQLIGIL
ncbi:hypothetical protein [Bacillus sp. REN3]|uniref:hypothetical protein n=1 Tax=Bacillus sp. REN3 TaxID=2802440 RepID=UPI001AED1296|nr:hypothetical protein [Bacillus sp. REN3]